jgi:hypothetical protein
MAAYQRAEQSRGTPSELSRQRKEAFRPANREIYRLFKNTLVLFFNFAKLRAKLFVAHKQRLASLFGHCIHATAQLVE